MISKITTKMIGALAALLILCGAPAHTALAADGQIELVIGTGSIKGKIFAMGNGVATAVALGGKGVAIYNYATKGAKDNLKRISKKKRAINLAAVPAKSLAKAGAKQLKAISGLMSLGTHKGDTVLLVVRNKAPKGVSKSAYAKAVGEVVAVLNSAAAAKMIKREWSGWSPASGAGAFKSAGVKRHAAAAM
ncbi:MAG: hypothetical protein V3R85_03400 [Alphaproteobacteria bacterium]